MLIICFLMLENIEEEKSEKKNYLILYAYCEQIFPFGKYNFFVR